MTKTGIELIAQERTRQISGEGWTPDHDDAEHVNGELALAAACYAAPDRIYELRGTIGSDSFAMIEPWPWDNDWDKRLDYGDSGSGNRLPNPKTITRMQRLDLLAKAGALIASEIDRLQRCRA